MTRSEHIQWCKERALAYLPEDPAAAVTSMASDFSKHPETRETEPMLLMAGMLAAQSGKINQVESWINGFN